jgi:hypothetical protein
VVIIYGVKPYGEVDEQAGQYAVTRFGHVYYLPVVPHGSLWVTGPGRGIPTPLNLKSVVAAYMRTWGLLVGACIAIGCFSVSILLSILGVFVFAAGAGSWKLWRKRTTEDAKLRGNLNALAFGTYCSPELLSAPIREHYKLELQRRQEITQNARPPEDVARFGTRDLGELVRSYGILSLHGSSHAREQLSQLLELKAPSAELSDGIYRNPSDDTAENVQLPADRPAMIAAIEGAASQRMLRA